MKKVFSTLVLTSLLAVLLVPIMASAAFITCSSTCSTKVTADCLCGGSGGTPLDKDSAYCYNSKVYSSKTDCEGQIGGGTTGGGLDTPEKLIALINRIGGYVFQALLAIAGIFLVMAGFFFVTAGGNPEGINKARQMLINALIGVAVAVAAQGLKTIVMNLVS